MRLEMPQPCSGSRAIVFRISRSSVPCSKSDGFGTDASTIDNNTSTIDSLTRTVFGPSADAAPSTLQAVWPPDTPGPLIGLGCMRLSTERDRDEGRAVEVLQAAFDAGVTLVDTADAYCWDEHDAGHNERLIARALAAWNGDRSRILVA